MLSSFAETRKKFRSLDTRGKLQFIWDYYRYHILGAVIAIIFIYSLIPKGQPPQLTVLMANTSRMTTNDQECFEPFLEQQGVEVFENCIYCAKFNLQDREGEGYYDEFASLSAHVSAGGDLFFATDPGFSDLARQRVLVNLLDILPQSILEPYEDRLYYYLDEESGETFPCAILLSGEPWLEETGYYEECYFGVLKNAKHPELAAQFALYLLTLE